MNERKGVSRSDPEPASLNPRIRENVATLQRAAPSFPIVLLDDAIVAHMEAVVDVEAVEDYPLSQRSCLSDISWLPWYLSMTFATKYQ